MNELGEEVLVIDNAIYWGALIQAVIDFILIALILFFIFKLVGYVKNASMRAHKKLRKRILKRLKLEGKEVTEEVIPPAPVVEPKVSDEVLLLSEIRDLLKAKQTENNE